MPPHHLFDQPFELLLLPPSNCRRRSRSPHGDRNSFGVEVETHNVVTRASPESPVPGSNNIRGRAPMGPAAHRSSSSSSPLSVATSSSWSSSSTPLVVALLLGFLVSHVSVVGRVLCGVEAPENDVEFRSPNFITWDDLRIEGNMGSSSTSESRGSGGRVIVVSKNGDGDATTVQGAVDLVPNGNRERVKIVVLPGLYKEKIYIPYSKPYISLIGNDTSTTVIAWHARASDRTINGQAIGTLGSASFAVEADFFCATGITFKNTAPAASPGAKGMQAVALRISGDKAVFFRCSVVGSQDTLFDQTGRHYFSECYIRGAIDFIFGSARSLYKGCTLHADAASYGAIAASQRRSPFDDSGFSFVHCQVAGSGMLYLGRAWGRYARVVYASCYIQGIIIPQGWSDWGDPSRRSTAYFGEFNCSGPGANLTRRVDWAKPLTYDKAKHFMGKKFIDGKDWLRL